MNGIYPTSFILIDRILIYFSLPNRRCYDDVYAGECFFCTIARVSKYLYVRIVHHIENHKKASMSAAYEKMVRQYRFRGFIVKYMWVDNKF